MSGTNETKGAEHTKERAEFWRVSVRTMQKWLSMVPPVPVDDAAAMIRWYASVPPVSQMKLTKTFTARIGELRVEMASKSGVTIGDPDYAEFKRERDGKAGKDMDAMVELKRLRDFALYKIDRATAASDVPALNAATGLLRHFSGIIHDEELRAQRLGREMGDMLPRAQAEAIARALPYWMLKATDELIAELAPKLVAASANGALGHEQVRQIIEPALLSARVLTPFVRSAQVSTGVTLPQWLVDAMAAGLDGALQDGAAEFARLYGEKVA